MNSRNTFFEKMITKVYGPGFSSFLAVSLVLMLTPRTVHSQTTLGIPRFEVYAGYAHFPETDSLIRSFSDPGHGFSGGLDLNFTRHWAGRAEFDTASWTVHAHGTPEFMRGDQDVRVSFFSIGPRYAVQIKRLSFFGMGTMDFKRSRFSSQTIRTIRNGVPEDIVVASDTAKAGGFGWGGGADLKLTRQIALRMIELNNSIGSWGEGANRDFRIKTGVVFKFR